MDYYICVHQLRIMAKKKNSITEKMFKELQQELKDLNMQWVILLVKQIKEDKAIEKKFKEVNDRKVYNVFNGIVKDGAWKLLIYQQAIGLKARLEKAVQEILS